MNITGTQLAKRVAFWQKHLAPMGLAHWRIEEVVQCGKTPGSDHANASVFTSASYDSCTFFFTFAYLEECDERRLDETIVHEWLHVFMRDFDQAIEAAEDHLSQAAADTWRDRVDHEREGVVDRMARTIVALHYTTK